MIKRFESKLFSKNVTYDVIWQRIYDLRRILS